MLRRGPDICVMMPPEPEHPHVLDSSQHNDHCLAVVAGVLCRIVEVIPPMTLIVESRGQQTSVEIYDHEKYVRRAVEMIEERGLSDGLI